MPWIERIRTEQPLDAGVGIDLQSGILSPTSVILPTFNGSLLGSPKPSISGFSSILTPRYINGGAALSNTANATQGLNLGFNHGADFTIVAVVSRPQNPGTEKNATIALSRGLSISPNSGVEFDAGSGFFSASDSKFRLTGGGSGSGSFALFVDGVKQSSASVSDVTIQNGQVYKVVGVCSGVTTNTELMYGIGGLVSRAFGAAIDIFLYAHLPYKVTNDVARSLSSNPWQILEKERIWVPVAAGGDTYTLTADSGSFALTGQDTALNFNRTLAADSGSFALTGQAAALTFNRTLVADSGSFALAGQDATPTFSRVLSAASGSYALAGQDATLTYTPISGATYTLAAASGSFALAGQGAVLLQNRSLAADSGSFALTGQDATLARGYMMPAQSGDYSVAGQDAALIASRRLAADSEAFALTGQNADLTYSNAPPAVVAGAVVGRRMAVTGRRPDRLQTSARPAR